jgi:hypothetical protein
MNAVPPAAIGKASGACNTLRRLGGMFGIAILAALFAARGGYATPAAFNHGVAPALGVAAGMSVVGAMIGLATPGRRRRRPDVSSGMARRPALVGGGGNNATR